MNKKKKIKPNFWRKEKKILYISMKFSASHVQCVNVYVYACMCAYAYIILLSWHMFYYNNTCVMTTIL